MKILTLLATSILLMTSCKMTDHYYLTGKTEKIIIEDTICFPAHHFHYEDEKCNNYCIYIEECSYPYSDTLEVEIIKKKKIRVKKTF